MCQLVAALGSARDFCTLEERRRRDASLRQQKLEIMQMALVCGTRHIYNNRPALTLPAAKQALSMAAEVFGASSVELVRPFLMLASACVMLGELDSAEGYLSQGEWTLIYAKSTDDSLRALLFRGWAQLLAARREWLQAKWCCAEDVHHSTEAFGPDDVRCTLGYYRLAASLLQLEKFDIVASLYRQIVQMWHQYFYTALKEGVVDHQLCDQEVIEAVHVLGRIQQSLAPPPEATSAAAASSTNAHGDSRQWWRQEENAECVAKLELVLNRLRNYNPSLELPTADPSSVSPAG